MKDNILTWNDCFNDSLPDNVRYIRSNDSELLMCFIYGAAVHVKRDYLHVDFHNKLVEKLDNEQQ